MSKTFRRRAVGMAIALAAPGALALAAAPAQAIQVTENYNCTNGVGSVTARVNTSNVHGNGGWASAQILLPFSGIGTPTAITVTIADTNVGGAPVTLSAQKGSGNANQNQSPTTDCTLVPPMTGTVAGFLGQGPYPTGWAGSDPATASIDVTVVLKQ